MSETVYIVHCVDTEGPLYEDIEATFERIENILGIQWPEHSYAALERLRSGEEDLGDKQEMFEKIFSDHLAGFNGTWREVEQMLENVTSLDFLNKHQDAFGGCYRLSWFILDIVDFETNPRRRAFGYHSIFDFYRELFKKHAIT